MNLMQMGFAEVHAAIPNKRRLMIWRFNAMK